MVLDLDSDIAWCDSCWNIVGSTVFNENEIFQTDHVFCNNCIRTIIERHDKHRKTGHPLMDIPDSIEEKVYSLLRVSFKIEEWNVCDYCGRLWKEDKRITIPHGKCKKCITDPKMYSSLDWYIELENFK